MGSGPNQRRKAHPQKRRSLVLALAVAVVACNKSPLLKDAERPDGKMPLRYTQAFVVPPNRLIPADELAEAVRSAGHPCEEVTGFSQLELKGKPLDNYKLDCGARSYLVTWLENGSRIRPWSGSALDHQ